MLKNKKRFSIVLPIYGNEKNLPITIPYIMEHLHLFNGYDVEIILVNDGSPDASWEIMVEYQKKYPEVLHIVHLTRNFGQLAAWRCGMDMAKGDVIGFISADLQDPFELFADMLKEWENGYSIVVAARTDRIETGVSVLFSKIFQKLVHVFVDKRYPKGGFDFFLIDKTVKEKYTELHKSNTLTQLWLLWLGYKVKEIPYIRNGRTIGESGYTFWMKVEMGLRVFTVYSKFLVNGILSLGLLLIFLAAIGGVAEIIIGVNGYDIASLVDMFLVGSLFSGVNLVALGIIGNYLWNTMNYCKGNPPYLIDEIIDEEC